MLTSTFFLQQFKSLGSYERVLPLQTGRTELHFPSWQVIDWLPTKLKSCKQKNVTILP